MEWTYIIFVVGLVFGLIIALFGSLAKDEGTFSLGFVMVAVNGGVLVILGVIWAISWLVLITNAAIITVNG